MVSMIDTRELSVLVTHTTRPVSLTLLTVPLMYQYKQGMPVQLHNCSNYSTPGFLSRKFVYIL